MAVRRSLLRWEAAGFVTVCVVGTLLQFLYKWSGENSLVAAFAGVNESTWEHMKTLYLPYFIFTTIQFTVFAEPFRNFFAAKAAAGLAGTVLIPVLFYTLSGAFGRTPAWINLAIFYVSAAVMYLVSWRLLSTLSLRGTALQLAGFALLWGLAFTFVLLTWRAPHLPLFADPRSGQYGIPVPGGAS